MRWFVTTALVALPFALALPDAAATAQASDVLVVSAEERELQTNPLEPYFVAHPYSRPKSEIYSTGLWRGYVASWEIADGRLLLTDVQVLRRTPGTDTFETELYSVMSTVFPGQPRVFADWFTGYLIAASGDLLEYVHMGYASTYERYSVFTVVNGVVKAEKAMTARQFTRFRKAQFRAYKKTEEYAGAFKDLDDGQRTASFIEEFLFEYSGDKFMSIIFDDSLQR